MWDRGWRDDVWSCIDGPWDLIIIGGGITGAGILREAARMGLRTLLVEGRDFASGTSSRSSKLVHGGFRYLREAKFRLTYHSVREREALLKQGRGLVNPLGFLLANYANDRIPGWVFGAGLIFYDIMGLQWGHRHYGPEGLRSLCPQLVLEGLQGGYRYFDAQTDDARLVLRVIREAVADGAVALNYARVENVLRTRNGSVRGISLRDISPNGHNRMAEIQAKVVINATGAWADTIRSMIDKKQQLRKLRGSHLIFPQHALPLTRAVSFLHPADGRPVFALPWEGVTIYGTTDIEHRHKLNIEPTMDIEEIDYLMEGLQQVFDVDLSSDDLLATFAGVRAVVDTGKVDPSRESREHVIWDDRGLVTVTGGKLTTFRVMAIDALRSIHRYFSKVPLPDRTQRVFNQPPREYALGCDFDPAICLRLLGRYGDDAPKIVACAEEGELETIGESPYLWAELRWTARAEGIVHLEDLIMRRVRLGLTLPQGGWPCIDRVRAIAQSELGWDNNRWFIEQDAYANLWNDSYRPPSSPRIALAAQ
jgi:glycerol-3-phosphate dehydrogenase